MNTWLQPLLVIIIGAGMGFFVSRIFIRKGFFKKKKSNASQVKNKTKTKQSSKKRNKRR